jgi:histone H3/H4
MTHGLDFDPEQTELAIDQMMHFVGAVLEPEALYELRPTPPKGYGSVWSSPCDFRRHVATLMGWNREGVNPYFSLNPRRALGFRKGEDSIPGSVVVADFDEPIELDAAKTRIAAAGLPLPTAIVNTSTDRWHAYWRLEARLPDLATHKRIQQGLSDKLGTCPNVCSHQQVMRLPGPFCNVKPDRPTHPRVMLVECDPNRIYPAAVFPMADLMPEIVPVPLEELAIKIEKGSLSDASRALIENSILFDHSGRRTSIFKAARDMNARGWTLADARDVLVSVGGKLGLEREDVSDIPRQVRNAFSRPSNPGYAAAETIILDVEASAPRPAADTGSEYDADLEALPLPLPPPMPPRPSLALSHGIIGTFMDRVEEETEAHPVALGVSFITAFGNCIGRSPHAMVGCTRHGINLFSVVVGNTGTGRKGTGGDIVTTVVRYADSYWADRCQSPNLTSGEGVIDALRDAVTKFEQKKGGGPNDVEEVVLDWGVSDKRLLITCAEWVAALRAASRESSTLSQTLREAWDGKTLRTMAKNTPRTATDPHLSIIAHVTRQELIKALRDADIYGGLFNRCLFVLSERARLLPHGGDLDDLHEILEPIKARIEFARGVGRMVRSDAADRLWEREYERLTTATGSDLISAVLSRAEAQTLRLSMLMALAAGRATIEASDLEAALDLWRYSEASARAVFAGDNDALFDRLHVLIHETPGITRSALHKKVGWKVPAPTFLGTLSRLQAIGLARSEAVKTGGRPTEKWFPAPAVGKEEKEEKGRQRRRRPPAEAFPAFPPFHPDSAPAATGNTPAEAQPDQSLPPGSYRI